MRDYYVDLELSPTATEEDIRKQHNKLVLKYHPDKNPENGNYDKFLVVQAAYEILRDKKSRLNYDKERLRRATAKPDTTQERQSSSYTKPTKEKEHPASSPARPPPSYNGQRAGVPFQTNDARADPRKSWARDTGHTGRSRSTFEPPARPTSTRAPFQSYTKPTKEKQHPGTSSPARPPPSYNGQRAGVPFQTNDARADPRKSWARDTGHIGRSWSTFDPPARPRKTRSPFQSSTGYTIRENPLFHYFMDPTQSKPKQTSSKSSRAQPAQPQGFNPRTAGGDEPMAANTTSYTRIPKWRDGQSEHVSSPTSEEPVVALEVRSAANGALDQERQGSTITAKEEASSSNKDVRNLPRDPINDIQTHPPSPTLTNCTSRMNSRNFQSGPNCLPEDHFSTEPASLGSRKNTSQGYPRNPMQGTETRDKPKSKFGPRPAYVSTEEEESQHTTERCKAPGSHVDKTKGIKSNDCNPGRNRLDSKSGERSHCSGDGNTMPQLWDTGGGKGDCSAEPPLADQEGAKTTAVPCTDDQPEEERHETVSFAWRVGTTGRDIQQVPTFCPNPPTRPSAPELVLVSGGPLEVGLSQRAWDQYVTEINNYMREWSVFNRKLLCYFYSRQNAIEAEIDQGWVRTSRTSTVTNSITLKGKGTEEENHGTHADDNIVAGENGASSRTSAYLRVLDEDGKLQRHWEIALESHRECIRRFQQMQVWIMEGGKLV